MSAPELTDIRGTLYRSQRAAADALGLSPQAINAALQRGTIHTVGLRQRGRKGHPCYMNGRQWPSRTAAACALRVTRAAISRAIAQGRTYVRPGVAAQVAT